MWQVRYNAGKGSDNAFFTLCELTADDKELYQTTTKQHTPNGITSITDQRDTSMTVSTPEVDEEMFSWVKTEFETSRKFSPDTNKVPVVNGVRPSSISSTAASADDGKSMSNGNLHHSFIVAEKQTVLRRQMPLQSETILQDQSDRISVQNHRPSIEDTESKDKKDTKDLIYGNQKQIFWAVFVRFLLICHNVLTVWRVTEVYDERFYWLITLANILMLLELQVVVIKRAGVDYSWWTPCFLIYLLSTIPAVWLLQLKQQEEAFLESQSPAAAVILATTQTISSSSLSSTLASSPSSPAAVTFGSTTASEPSTTLDIFASSTIEATTLSGLSTSSGATATTQVVSTIAEATINSTLAAINNTLSTTILSTFLDNSTVNDTITTTPKAVVEQAIPSCQEKEAPELELDDTVWVIIIQESMVYLLVFSRWLLPRGSVTRAFLADLLLEFLAIASDIMELLAIFEEPEVRVRLDLTYVIMAVWSASFIQFIPVLMHKRRFRHFRNPRISCISRWWGDKFVEFVVTCMSIFLQDLPFLVVRLYVIFKVKIITYSLIFFVLKNMVTLMLLSYRIVIIGRGLPFCRSCAKQKR